MVANSVPARDRWGPFELSLPPAEQRARLRCLRAITRLICGPRGRVLEAVLRAAEHVPGALEQAVAELKRLEPTDLRRVLATYGAMR